MTLGPIKHEKVARIGRISNVFRSAGAQGAEQFVGIIGVKIPFDPNIILYRKNYLKTLRTVVKYFHLLSNYGKQLIYECRRRYGKIG